MDDRYRDGFGGVGRIYYQTLSRYARDHDLAGSDFDLFIVLIGDEMDDEYLTWMAEQRAAQKTETPQ